MRAAVPLWILLCGVGAAHAVTVDVAAKVGVDVAVAVADPFLRPFDATRPLVASPSSSSPTVLPCRDCHAEVAREWEGSRHRRAGDNTVFVAGYAQEPHVRCAVCHAPEGDEWRRAGRRGQRLDHGVGCASCHVRDGAIWSSRPARGYGHDVKVAPSLGDERLCTTCHEFFAHRVDDGVVTLLPDVPMQTTTSEWRAWRARTGRSETCQACHMKRGPDGHASHTFHSGGHDVSALAAALVVDVDAAGRSATFASRDVGHRYPTGDIFRRLVVDVDGVEVAVFGKAFGSDQRLLHDTTLVPGKPVHVALPRGRRLRVTYHYADDAEEARGRISYEQLVAVVVDQALPGAPP